MSTSTETTQGKVLSISNNDDMPMAKGMAHPGQMPLFSDKHQERKFVKEHLAAAFRVFGRKQFDEGNAGHMSVRDPVDPKTFWINPLGVHFCMMRVSDLVHVDGNGNILPDGNQVAFNSAGFSIHYAIHHARPDINAVCHAHTIYGKAFSALGKPLAMINQDACIFYKSHVVYDDFGGVAIEASEGEEIAERLGDGRTAILQNHGLITSGRTIDEAAYLFCLMEKTCQCQLLAEAALQPGETLKTIRDKEAYFTEKNTAGYKNMYACFQPDYNYELRLDSSFLE